MCQIACNHFLYVILCAKGDISRLSFSPVSSCLFQLTTFADLHNCLLNEGLQLLSISRQRGPQVVL